MAKSQLTPAAGKSNQQNLTRIPKSSLPSGQKEGMQAESEHIADGVLFSHGLSGQVALLSDGHIPEVQRQEIARAIGRVQPNQYLQRVFTGLHNSEQVVQRTTLTSPRFSSDSTLTDIANGTGTLKSGDTGDAVRKVQHAIADFGILYRAYGVDGEYGDETTRTVNRFQRNTRVSGDPTGEVGPNTLEKLDQAFPAMALPTTAGDAYTNLSGILAILSQWNAAMIRDLRSLRVHMVADLKWADERWNGTSWAPKPMEGAGETSGQDIYIATDATNEEVASALYHEYQHARSPYSYRSASWTAEEERVYTLETQWKIDRGMTTDPNLTTTDPTTGETEVNPSGVSAHVETYPGLAATQPGEVIGKVGTNRVQVQLPSGRRITRDAEVGDSVPGRRVTTPPIHNVTAAEWQVIT